MNAIAALSAGYSAQAVQSVQRPESAERGPDHDGDADDRAGAIGPATNTSGQTVGTTISVKA